ncbi:MAG: c-type cytochrome, partial [Rhodoferax sp.]
VPGTAAIANAIFDATGVRFRQPPFTPDVVRAALNPPPAELARPPRRRKGGLATFGAVLAGVVGVAGAIIGLRPAVEPVVHTDPSIYTAVTIERGRQLAAAGDCAVCHTAPGGNPNAGGRAMATPFGTVYTTNLTPDPETGIGHWSFSAFQRAMREGISRDGKHLYPAFPYTAFTRISDDDLMALYAYLMTQPPVRAQVPETRLAFPFGVRPLMAVWNALYLDPGPAPTDAARSAQWNRGAYLVNGVGHCAACHSPRNMVGAEQGGRRYLGGAMVDGWEAPSLTAQSHAPVPWTEGALYQYLRHGHTEQHGMATGPMGPVVKELATLPAADVRAMAHYLASFQSAASPQQAAATAQVLVNRAETRNALLASPAQRLFDSACGACHRDGNGLAQTGRNIPLALNSNLYSEHPDNLLRVVLEGISEPATSELGFMPTFRHSLDDRQIAELAGYMRQRFAPGRPPWRDLEAAAKRIRQNPSTH